MERVQIFLLYLFVGMLRAPFFGTLSRLDGIDTGYALSSARIEMCTVVGFVCGCGTPQFPFR